MTPHETDDLRSIAAHHEAGHAVVGAALGSTFVRSWLEGSGAGWTEFGGGFLREHPHWFILRCLAGPAAEAHLLGRPIAEVLAGATDERMAMDVLDDVKAPLSEALAAAESMVELHWPAIVSVAEVLLDRGTIEAEEFSRLFDPHLAALTESARNS